MSKTDNSVKIQLISTIGVIIVALITFLVPKLFNDKLNSEIPSSRIEVSEDSIERKQEPEPPSSVQYIDRTKSTQESNFKEILKVTGGVYFQSEGVPKANVSIAGYGSSSTNETGDFSIILNDPLKGKGENLTIIFSHPDFEKRSLNRTFYGGRINLYFE